MCIIVDACCAGALGNGALPQSKLILDWVKAGGRVVSGGKLEEELRGTNLQALLVQWKASGRLLSIDSALLEDEASAIDADKLKSNDLHVVALAKVSGAQAVVTRDRALMFDLKKSPEIKPARKVYPFPETAVNDLRVQRGVLRASGCK
jgi:hypothetical protein